MNTDSFENPDVPVSEEYSVETQLDVLGVYEGMLTDPIVDLGCGKTHMLVDYLHEKGHKTVGIDTAAEGGGHIIAESWFDVEFPPASVGTIISHMAFSRNFISAHINGKGFEDYARLYRELLDALVLDGMFLYTPGLPFVETHIDAKKYMINKRPIQSESDMFRNIRDAVSGKVGTDVFYTTVITRLL